MTLTPMTPSVLSLLRPSLFSISRHFFPVVSVPHRYRSCGMVGLPNVGKSSLFNALTKTQLAQAANYPFCTIDPLTAAVSMADPRLQRVGTLAQSKKIIPVQIEFTDIAGLVQGASQGKGLGNQFLSNIRTIHVILHVLRCHNLTDIVHVHSDVNSVKDMEIIETELILADLHVVEKKYHSWQNKPQKNHHEKEVITKVYTILNEGISVCDVKGWTEDEQKDVDALQLISSKPSIYVGNIDEESASKGKLNENSYVKMISYEFEVMNRHPNLPFPHLSVNDEKNVSVLKKLHSHNLRFSRSRRELIPVCIALENELISSFASSADVLGSSAARTEYMQMNDMDHLALDKIIDRASELLNLHCFYSVGPEEAKAWSIPRGANAVIAASKIHTDIGKGLINAEIVGWKEFIEFGGEEGCRKAGKYRVEGKSYILQDGDICDFRFNRPSKK